MSKSLTKKELRAPDSFQEIATRGADWIEANIHLVLSVVTVIIVGCLIWIGYGFYSRYAETHAEKALFPAEQTALNAISTAKDSEGLQISTYIDSLKANNGRVVTLASAMDVIAALNTKENTEGLQKQVMEAADFTPSQNQVIYGLWFLTKAQVLKRNGERASAKEAFQKIIDSKEQSEFHPMALLQMGTLAEEDGDMKTARDIYQRVTHEFPESEAKKMAEKLLIHIDVLGKGSNTSS